MRRGGAQPDDQFKRKIGRKRAGAAAIDDEALGTVRVMRTGGMMGEVVGMAASLCKKNACLPRDIYASHLEELKALMAKGVGLGKEQPPQNYNLGGTLLKTGKKEVKH